MAYSPTLARWMEQDPEPYVDGVSNYQFVRSNPIAHRDPKGTLTDDELLARWDKVDTAIDPKQYNCAGLAFRTYNVYENWKAIRDTLKEFQPKPGTKKDNCKVYFWFWLYKLEYLTEDPAKGGKPKPPADQPNNLMVFHVVSARAKADGSAPKEVYSKNGTKGQLEGPVAIADAKLHQYDVFFGQWVHRVLVEEIEVCVTIDELRKLIALK
jgi:hypothetical protein